jgi:hypothetical protein
MPKKLNYFTQKVTEEKESAHSKWLSWKYVREALAAP